MSDMKAWVEEFNTLSDYHSERMMRALLAIEIAKDSARKELDAYRNAYAAWRAKLPQLEVQP